MEVREKIIIVFQSRMLHDSYFLSFGILDKLVTLRVPCGKHHKQWDRNCTRSHCCRLAVQISPFGELNYCKDEVAVLRLWTEAPSLVDCVWPLLKFERKGYKLEGIKKLNKIINLVFWNL